jgi:predicted dehydrogenase
MSTTICDPPATRLIPHVNGYVPGRAEEAARRFGAPHAFTDYEDLLDRGELDAVTIASPIGLHYEQGCLALDAGKHIHFNKTMTTTAAEATDLIERSRAKRLVMVASPGEMLRPHNQYIKQLIADGRLGTLCWAACGSAFGTYHEDEAVRHGDDVLATIDPRWYYRKPGGGPLYDMTVYALHALTGILGPARRVTAMSGIRLTERRWQGQAVPIDADDNTLLLLDFGDSLFALAYGTARGSLTQGFSGTYFGTGGTIVGQQLDGAPLAFPGHEMVAQAGWVANQWLLPHVVGPHCAIEEQHVFEDIMQLVDWVRDGTPSIVTPEHARHVIEIIEAGYRAAETGQAQELSTAFP